MRFTPVDPPRRFAVGRGAAVEVKDCGRIEAAPEEQVTFVTESGGEYDVLRKSWGFYATPSLNHRLPRFGLRGALVRNRMGHRFVVLVESGREAPFREYLSEEGLEIVFWLDGEEPGGTGSELHGGA